MESRPAKVLVLDDDPDIVETLAEILREEGYEVETRAERNVDDVETVDPDLVHIDCPPGATKQVLNFAQRLRLNRKTAPIPLIIAVSSVKLLEPVTLRDQMIHVLVRPFEIDDFIGSVRDLVTAGRNARKRRMHPS